MAHLPQIGLKHKNKALETSTSYFGFVKKQLTIFPGFQIFLQKPTCQTLEIHWVVGTFLALTSIEAGVNWVKASERQANHDMVTWPLIYRCGAPKTQHKSNIYVICILSWVLFPKYLIYFFLIHEGRLKVWKSITKQIRSIFYNIQEIFQTVIKFMLNNYAIIIYQNMQIYIYIFTVHNYIFFMCFLYVYI